MKLSDMRKSDLYQAIHEVNTNLRLRLIREKDHDINAPADAKIAQAVYQTFEAVLRSLGVERER